MFKLHAAKRLLIAEDHQWIDKVEDKQESKPDNAQGDFPEGFFKGSPSSIASGLKAKSKDLKQAMSRLNFYINRSGKNLSSQDKNNLEQAKDALRKLYGVKDKETKLSESGPQDKVNQH